MSEKIKVEIYGIKDKVLESGCGCTGKKEGCSSGGCGNKKSSCDGCGSGSNSGDSGCESRKEKTVGKAYSDLEKYINESDVFNSVQLEFVDLNKNDLKEEKYNKVKEIIDKGFEPPITVVDGIIRYYGGISDSYIYKDVKELLEE